MEAALARCMNEVDQYPDPFNTPVNINSCGGVMDSVLAPFTQESVNHTDGLRVY
jgi:carboxypeptidase D